MAAATMKSAYRMAVIALVALAACAQEPQTIGGAIEAYSKAIESTPDSPDLYNRRGSAYFMAGEIEKSIEDFDRAVELSPRSDPHHWQRGISYYYAERFTDGREQFKRHQTVNPNDVENGVWHFLCAARETNVEDARKKMLPISGDPRVPMAEIYELFRGKGTVEQVLSAAGDDRAPLFYAHLYLGLYFEALGEEDKAREHIRTAAEDYSIGHYMWHVARVHAARFD